MAPRPGPLVIPAARVITPAGVVGPARVVVEDGLIGAVEPLPLRDAAPDITIVPGFVDLQVNGIADVDVALADGDDWQRLDRSLLAHGVTTWCPTLITAPLASYGPALARMAAAAAERDGATDRPTIAGAHLEGPFLGGAPGVHPVEHIRPLDCEWLAALPPIVRLVTLAPESPGAVDAISALTAAGLTVALGHSRATYDEAGLAVEAGATLVTHLFNGMAGLHHRQPGLVGVALADDRLTVSLIADRVHVHPAVLATVFRAKGAERVALVTDSLAWQAPARRSAGMTVTDGAPRTPAGTLAGSVLTMAQAVRNIVSAGVDLVDAVTAASTTPARVLGLTDRGMIAPGQRADLVALHPALHVAAVWVRGRFWTA